MKIATIALIMVALVANSSGQGYVDFQNAAQSAIVFKVASGFKGASTATIGSQTGNGSSGVVDVGLYWSTSPFTDPAQGTLADVATMLAPQFSEVLGIIAGNEDLPIVGTSPGESIYVQIFAWDSTFADPDAAIAAGAYFGTPSVNMFNTEYGAVGAPRSVVLGNGAPLQPPPGAFSPFTPTILLQSPEPGTFALTGAAIASVLLFRRRL